MGVRDQPIAPSSPWHRVRHAIPALRLQSEKTRGPCGLGIGIMAASSFCRTLFVAGSIGRIANDPVAQQASIQGPCCDRSRQSATLSSAQAELAWVLHRAEGPLLRHSRRLGWTLPKSASRPSTSSPCAIAYLQTIASAFGAIADVAGLAAGSPVWRLTLNEHAAPGFTRFARAW
jgi:hypothetical protein